MRILYLDVRGRKRIGRLYEKRAKSYIFRIMEKIFVRLVKAPVITKRSYKKIAKTGI